ncbi:MAG: hypothetical protein KF833_12130 [Verrucomicrobiae bacterium]|nr:hypothetical protein [Verrucomicrobiae bacterium]
MKLHGIQWPARLATVGWMVAGLAGMGEARAATVHPGSDGSDGVLTVTRDLVIDMDSRPDGIYRYAAVHVREGAMVTFRPNARNTPVVWLVQGSCVIEGIVDVSGTAGIEGGGGPGGPGGFRGGNAGARGLGPGGGPAGVLPNGGWVPESSGGAFATVGFHASPNGVPPEPYGSKYLLPLVGGSGGGGAAESQTHTGVYTAGVAGGGGGGAFLIAADRVRLTGRIEARGGAGELWDGIFGHGNRVVGGSGSGGAVRIVANRLEGNGIIHAGGGPSTTVGAGGAGRVRIDCIDDAFGGSLGGVVSRGFQPVVFPAPDALGVSLRIAQVEEIAVEETAGSDPGKPGVILPFLSEGGQRVTVECRGLPLGTEVLVTATSAVTGEQVTVAGRNDRGTEDRSYADIRVPLPPGSGLLWARTRLVTLGEGE